MKLLKCHGLGNDYLIITDDLPFPPTPRQVVLLCQRNRGVGGDGILVPTKPKFADYGVIIYNPDGSVAEMSGNGLRIFAHWLYYHKKASSRFSVEVAGRSVNCLVERPNITLEMGKASFCSDTIPSFITEKEAVNFNLSVSGSVFKATSVNIGNPHCVIFVDNFDLPWRSLGKEIENHNLFPARINVQFARIISKNQVEIRIWERGAGETLASGSSSCAVVAAGVKTGQLDPVVDVYMPGGTLKVAIKDWQVFLSGPVNEVGKIALSKSFLDELNSVG